MTNKWLNLKTPRGDGEEEEGNHEHDFRLISLLLFQQKVLEDTFTHSYLRTTCLYDTQAITVPTINLHTVD